MQDLTRKKVSDFLHGHSAYELIPESGKVVLLDVDLPVRQAFHALHEQVRGAWAGGWVETYKRRAMSSCNQMKKDGCAMHRWLVVIEQ